MRQVVGERTASCYRTAPCRAILYSASDLPTLTDNVIQVPLSRKSCRPDLPHVFCNHRRVHMKLEGAPRWKYSFLPVVGLTSSEAYPGKNPGALSRRGRLLQKYGANGSTE